MAAAVHSMQSSAASSSTTLQGAATTAPVLEFVCLFTPDLRRKQKRWQDGRLKYHTFNRRVMVYDERGNFVGDTHWREDYPLCDGEELQLERGGVIVQVAECTGSREQDLSELVDKRAQEKAQRQSAALARRHPTLEPPTPQPAVATSAHFQPRHRPLHQLIGTPTGHHGRALIPSESPYQQRQQQLIASPNQDDADRPTKRRKRDISPPSKSGYAQSLFGTTLTLSGRPMSSAPIRRRPASTALTQRDDPCPTSSDRSNRDSDMEPTPLAPRPAAFIEQRVANSAGNRSSSNVPRRVLASPPREDVESRRASSPILIEDTPEQHQSPDVAQGHNSTTLNAGKDSRVLDKKKRNPLQPVPANENRALASDTKRASDGVNTKDRPLDNDYARRAIKWREERRRAAEIGQPEIRRGANAELALHTEKVSMDLTSASRSSKEIDVTDSTERSPNDRLPTNEPKTELRIRPRKKPGLLMLSDKTSVTEPNQKRKSISAKGVLVDISAPGPLEEIDSNRRGSKSIISKDSRVQALGSGDRSKRNTRTQQRETGRQTSVSAEGVTEIDKDELNPSERESSARKSARGKLKARGRALKTSSRSVRSTDDVGRSGDESIEEMEGTPPLKGPRRKRTKTVTEHEDDIKPEVSNLESRSRRSKRTRKSGRAGTNARSEEPDSSLHSDQEEVDPPEVAPAPRLAKIKNGIRTREIIGFVWNDEDDEEDLGETNVPADDKPNELHHPPEDFRAQARAAPDAAVLQDSTAAASPQMTIQPSSKQDDNLTHVTEEAHLENPSGKDKEPSSGCPMDQITTAATLPTDISSQSHGAIPDTSPAEPQPPLTRPQVSEHLTKPSLPDESGAQQDKLRDVNPIIHQPDNPYGQDKPVQDVPDLGGNVQRAASTDVEATLSKAAVARRTMNPASRGRKAAKPSDAAGQLPQCPLPPEARSIGVPRPMNGKKVDEARKQDKGVVTPLPGFAKANGGPWSREAFDLFEFKRPT